MTGYGHHPGRSRPGDGPEASASMSYPAGVDLSGHLVVWLRDGLLWAADKDDPALLPDQVVGMTAGAAKAGAMARVVQAGPVPGLAGLTLNTPYFLGTAGQPTATRPTSGWLMKVGTADDPATFHVRLETPVKLLG